MIILLGSQKGGCGKSTLAVNICAELARQGRDVVLVDADRQGTASRWADDRAENSALPAVHCVQRYENIRDTVLDLDGRYDFVVIDAAGRDSRELRTGMTAADILLVPFRPSQADLDTLPRLIEIITAATDINPKLKCQAVITMAPNNPSISELNDSKDVLADYPELRQLRVSIHDRKVYRDALSDGVGVVECDNPKAKGEVQILVKEMLNG